MQNEGFDIRQPFRRRAGTRAGYTDRRLRGPEFRHLFLDCYVAAGVPLTPSLLARGALLVRPGAAFASHHTAARLLDAAVPASPDVHLGTTGRSSPVATASSSTATPGDLSWCAATGCSPRPRRPPSWIWPPA